MDFIEVKPGIGKTMANAKMSQDQSKATELVSEKEAPKSAAKIKIKSLVNMYSHGTEFEEGKEYEVSPEIHAKLKARVKKVIE